MYHYRYATKEETVPVRAELEEIIHKVQDEVRNHFTFSYQFIGSSKNNLITYDERTNIGFDFDVNIFVNDDEENFSPKEIKSILMNAFNRFVCHYGYNPCEDSTSVFTIKFIDRPYSVIKHSCDFAIVYNGKKGQQYIRFNKQQNNYTWEYRSKGYKNIDIRTDWLKKNNHWKEVQNTYLDMKNSNTIPEKHSRSIYAETINNLYHKYN